MVTESCGKRLNGAQEWGQGNFSEKNPFPCFRSFVETGSFAIASGASFNGLLQPENAVGEAMAKLPTGFQNDSVTMIL